MPSGSLRSASAACFTNVGAASIASMRAPKRATERVFAPSPQPMSSPSNPATGGSMARNPGVLTLSRYTS
jgi:hypothetical protein